MKIYLTAKAEKQLGQFPFSIQKRIRDKIRFFADQQNIFSFSKYIATKNAYRLRIGDYRVFFTVEDGKIILINFVRRDRAYD